jgi:outer membrane murein-binding lipoprotein Lpp
MRPVDIASIAICLLIIALVLFSFFKHGRGNPETTGSLGRQLRSHATKLAEMEETLKGCATTAALGILSTEVRALEANAASSGEVLALAAKLNGLSDTINAKIDGVKAAADRTEAAVARIEDYFIRRGIDGK